MRGEKLHRFRKLRFRQGSPPHARGKVRLKHVTTQSRRITPACAGKRQGWGPLGQATEDHPRMRGEKAWKAFRMRRKWGSPPHARGKD